MSVSIVTDSRTIVIGGGLIGLTTAWELAARGQSVTLLERRDGLALETSYANGGLLTASMPGPWNGPGIGKELLASLVDPHATMKLRPGALPSMLGWGIRFLRYASSAQHHYATRAAYALAAYSVAETAKLREALKLDYVASTSGTMTVFRSNTAMREPVRIAAMLGELGLNYELLDAAGAANEEPQLAHAKVPIAGALRFHDDESGDAQLFCRSLADHLTMAGVTIELNSVVQRIISSDGSIRGVAVDQTFVAADRVVLAAGTATPRLTAGTGVKLPIKPVKGYSATLARAGIADWPRVPVVDAAKHVAIVPLGDRLRLVGTAELAGFDKTIRQARIDNLSNVLRSLYPRLAEKLDLERAETWTGLRPMSADGLPFIGPAGPTGLFVNSGHGQLGWTHAVGSAKLLADRMLGTRPVIDPSPYDADRYSR